MNQQSIYDVDAQFMWAFAKDTTKPVGRSTKPRLFSPKRNLQRYAITSCSPRLKTFGVKAGMRYNEAKALVPAMRVLVYNK